MVREDCWRHIQTIGQASANVPVKDPVVKIFSSVGQTAGFCSNESTCPCQAKAHQVSEWMWVRSNKTLILYELGNVNVLSLSHVTKYHFI